MRNHFDIPNLGGDNYRLSIGGLVERPLKLSMRELHNLHAESQVVTLECAGNGRSLFDPAVSGEAWGLGAVSTAEWTGVRLMEVLGGSGLLCPRILDIVRCSWRLKRVAVDGAVQIANHRRRTLATDARSPGLIAASLDLPSSTFLPSPRRAGRGSTMLRESRDSIRRGICERGLLRHQFG
ncbi:molybdopterin-dependent oxidoreductase [Sinorhizobium meliloti]|nr:molybdopterin-dependent oxidoreductase [Sinorhizobium meliloti]MDE4605761.1 molybdopterin-dependent oxidoreductase [Sinorhizobium meliloti]